MSTMMESDPIAPVSASGIPEKKTSPWFQFVARVRTLTGLSQPDAMRLAGKLRAEKAIDTWTDAEVSPRGVAWLRKNYLVMTPDMLRDKIDAVATLAAKKKEVAVMEAEVMAFVASVTAKGQPSLTAAAMDLQIYFTDTLPKQFTDASTELLSSATQEDAYATAMDAPDSVREKMKEIQTLEVSLQKEAAKAAKEVEKAAAKAAKETAKGCRDMAKCFTNGQRIRHTVGSSTWTGVYDSATASILHEGKHLSLNWFALSHIQAERPDRKAPNGNAWKDCECEVDGKWISTYSLPELPVATITTPAPSPAPAPSGGAGTAPASETTGATIDESRRKGIPKHIKTLVWNKYIGAATPSTKCLSCREELISIRSFHCGHVIAEAKGGDSTINNLRPICAPCNSSMGTMSMNEFTKTYFGWEV